MQWALDRFAQVRPDIAIKFEPQNNMFQDSFGIQLAGGSQAEAALLDGGFFHQWADKGGFVQINSMLGQAPRLGPDELRDVAGPAHDQLRQLAPDRVESGHQLARRSGCRSRRA